MDVSFGIEFEFDVIHKSGRTISNTFYAGRTFIPSWYYQDDPTAAVELRSPILKDIDHAISEISKQFNHWVSVLPEYAPYPYCGDTRELGQHIHIGRPDRELYPREAKALAHAAANVYPFMASLQCQPLPSKRGLTSRYTFPIWEIDWDIPHKEHWCEISHSHNGTVEFRIFDANIPQVSLVNAWILTEIAKKAFSRKFEVVEIDRERYRRDRELGLRFGLKALDIGYYLSYLTSLLGDIRIPNYPFIKEILYMAVKYRLNPFNIMLLSRVDRYEYFRYMSTNPDKFLEFFTTFDKCLKNEKLRKIIKDTDANADNIERLSDLNELSVESVPKLTFKPNIPIHSQNLVPRSVVAKYINAGEYTISRISEVHGLTTYEVAERIAYLLKKHGDNMVNPPGAEDIIRSPIRYYAFTVYNRGLRREDVLAAIAIDMRTGEISNLVVDRRYRRLGIATRLIDHVKEECNKPLWGYVREANVRAINLLRSLGFRLEPAENGLVKFSEVRG